MEQDNESEDSLCIAEAPPNRLAPTRGEIAGLVWFAGAWRGDLFFEDDHMKLQVGDHYNTTRKVKRGTMNVLHCLNQYSDIGYQPLWQNVIFSPAQRMMY